MAISVCTRSRNLSEEAHDATGLRNSSKEIQRLQRRPLSQQSSCLTLSTYPTAQNPRARFETLPSGAWKEVTTELLKPKTLKPHSPPTQILSHLSPEPQP